MARRGRNHVWRAWMNSSADSLRTYSPLNADSFFMSERAALAGVLQPGTSPPAPRRVRSPRHRRAPTKQQPVECGLRHGPGWGKRHHALLLCDTGQVVGRLVKRHDLWGTRSLRKQSAASPARPGHPGPGPPRGRLGHTAAPLRRVHGRLQPRTHPSRRRTLRHRLRSRRPIRNPVRRHAQRCGNTGPRAPRPGAPTSPRPPPVNRPP